MPVLVSVVVWSGLSGLGGAGGGWLRLEEVGGAGVGGPGSGCCHRPIPGLAVLVSGLVSVVSGTLVSVVVTVVDPLVGVLWFPLGSETILGGSLALFAVLSWSVAATAASARASSSPTSWSAFVVAPS